MNKIDFTYKTILHPTTSLFKDRGSKFLGFSFPLQHKEEVKTKLNIIKKEHPKANHFCYAYKLGIDGLSHRTNDDGEPSGSAGKPILGQIDSAGLTDILIIVCRYFGGTLLGIPGLINAYKTASKDCLSLAEVIEKNIKYKIDLAFSYPLLNEVMYVLKQFEVSIYHQEMLLFCEFTIGIPLWKKASCLVELNKIYGLEIKETASTKD